jgi:heme/copper-type cytochrome/quinol oxidase subunit 3
MTTTSALVTLFSAAIIAVFGVLIRYYGMVELVAGYDPEAVTDEAGLAAFVGTYTLLIAGATAAVGVAVFLQVFENSTILWSAYTVAVVLLTVRLVVGAQQFTES